MKRFFVIALTLCFLASALCIPALAAPDLGGTIQKSTDLAAIEGYIMLGIAIAGLIATIVSVILIATSDKRKKRSEQKKKDKEENK